MSTSETWSFSFGSNCAPHGAVIRASVTQRISPLLPFAAQTWDSVQSFQMVLIAFSTISHRPNPTVCSFVQFCELWIHLSHSTVNLKKKKKAQPKREYCAFFRGGLLRT